MKALNKLWSDMAKPKQELASQEVKLSAVEELERNTEVMLDEARELEGYIIDFDQQMDRAYGTYIMMKGLYESLTGDLGGLENDIDEVEAAGKQLGVEVPAVGEARRAIRQAEEAYGDAEERIRKFNL